MIGFVLYKRDEECFLHGRTCIYKYNRLCFVLQGFKKVRSLVCSPFYVEQDVLPV